MLISHSHLCVLSAYEFLQIYVGQPMVETVILHTNKMLCQIAQKTQIQCSKQAQEARPNPQKDTIEKEI